ncbi:MAG: FecR domain-containing protein, partial [Proteobacteria bacterium]|nr:FecR domain-containing protein [Pseudomonadota bacterium]
MEVRAFRAFARSNRKSIRKHAARLLAYFVSFSLAFSAPLSLAQTNEDEAQLRAGDIIFVSGEVVARDATGSDRQLRRRSDVFVGDTIYTALNASTQLRMVDGAVIALKESTEFAIVAYQYEENPSTDVSSIELVQGGFRTITGAIGQQNRENYEAGIAEFATIGIRGTDYEVVITPAGEVITGVYDGGTTIRNDAGTLDLGVGADFDFARVPNPQTPPQGLLLQPPQLGSVPLATVTDEDNGDGGDNGDGDADADNGNNDAGDGDGDNDGAAAATDDNAGDGGNDDDGGDAGNNDPPAATAGAPATQNTAAGNQGATVVINTGNTSNNSGTGAGGNALALAPPSAQQALVETPLATNLTSTDQLSTDVAVNPNETRGDGSVSCSNNSSSCQNGQASNSGNSSNASSGNASTGNSGNSDNSGNASTGNSGNSGNSGNASTGNSGNSG